MPTRASSGAVSSKIRPFDNAMLMLAMCHSANRLEKCQGGAFYRRYRALADSLDARAERAELGLERLVAAVEVIDAIDHRLAVGHQPRDHQPGRSTQIGGHDGCPLQALDAAHHRRTSLVRDLVPLRLHVHD